jgi:PAS domain-containing protein
MNPHFNSQQLILLFGGAVLVISALILAVYFVQKSFARALKPDEPKPAKVRVEDEAAFTLATVKGVITQLKTDQKVTQDKLVAAERRADENAHKFELLAREIDFGLMIFDAEGYITFSNALVRKVLAVDTWSRRRYGEIFHDLPVLSKLIGECFETGTETRNRAVEFQASDGTERRVEVSVLQTRDRSGALEVVACVFRELAVPAPDADEFIDPSI